LIYEKDVD